MTFRGIGENLFAVDSTIALPGVRLPLRSTIVRLGGGGVLVHSPIAFTDADAQRIEDLGEVRVIVAPSGLHYLHAATAQSRWPAAEFWAPRSVELKQPNLRVNHWFGESPWPYGGDLEFHPLAGAAKVSEVVFYHRGSETLVVVDLVFNVLEPRGPLAWLVFGIFGTYRHLDSSRLYRSFIEDKSAFAASLEPILSLPFRRLVMAHGEVVEGDDLPQRLRAVTRRLVK